jgi:hypothetical protein
VEPSAAIAIIETDLRALVRSLYGGDWAAKVSPSELEALANRREEEVRRRAPVAVPQDLLAYTHFYELRKVLASDWERVSVVLGKKREFDVWADHVEDFRNAPAHSRELLWHERALLEGIAGLIRVRVTKFRSSEGRDSMFYPVIESVVDSFGNSAEAPRTDGPMPIVKTGVILVPDQEVLFRARGTDPQGRDLTWKLIVHTETRDSAVGSEVELTWKVTEADVGASCFPEVQVKSSGRFHRRGQDDHAVAFLYRVDPPESDR